MKTLLAKLQHRLASSGPRLGSLFNRERTLPAGAITLADTMREMHVWREQLNPLRGLTINRAVELREQFLRGWFAEVQWTFFHIERSDEVLKALVDRRLGAVMEMDWEIKTVSDERADFDQTLADEQRAALREAYDRIDNLYAAIAHLATATFRGFAHLEKWRDIDGRLHHLEPVEQWFLVRESGRRGRWRLNVDAQMRSFESISDDFTLAEENWIIREVDRFIDWIALVKFVRANLCNVDWDSFVEIYGIPPKIIIGPPGVKPSERSEFESAAVNLARSPGGYLPHGSTVHNLETPRAQSPFFERLKYLDEQLVLSGTGGLLTMLTAPVGIGKGPSEQHEDAFRLLARAEGREISELFQRGVDREVFEKQFSGRPQLAYFELSLREEPTTTAVLDQVLKLAQAGYQVSQDQLEEKTGWRFESKPPAQTFGGGFGGGFGDGADPFADSSGGGLSNRNDEGGGRWVTVRGRRIFIEEGQSLEEALASGPKRAQSSAGKRDLPGENLEKALSEKAGGKSSLKVKPVKDRAWTGERRETKTKLTKLETGEIGESVAIAYLKSKGFSDARSLNVKVNNFPVDLVHDHEIIEVKAGLVSNQAGAQHWRATIGQPGKKERAWLAKASPEEKSAWNARKAREIMKRKMAAAREISKRLGRPVKTKTMALIIDPDKRRADLYEFKGFHLRIGWKTPQAQAGYVGSYAY